jgi:TolA-binding protein
VARGKYQEAIPRLQRMLASKSADDRAHRSEAQYLLGVACFKRGDLDGAATALDAVLAEAGKAYYRDDAAYLRFKIGESRYVAAPSAETQTAYERAIAFLLREFPGHKAAPEARFRLGEVYQRQQRYADAIAEYAKVKGDPPFELQAAFATAQCAMEQLEAAADDAAPDPTHRKTAEDALTSFWRQVGEHAPGDFRDAPVDDMKGRAALLSAYLAALADPPDYEQALHWLDGYEKTYPQLAGELPKVVKLRLEAFTRLGRLEAVAAEAERPEVATLDPAFLDHLVRRLLTTAAREKARGNEVAARAGKRAATVLCERALASPAAAHADTQLLYRLRATLASLYEEAGDTAQALDQYRALLAADADALGARAGVARMLEADGKSEEARALWDDLLRVPEGKSGWLEAHYQSARLSLALGDTARACALLRAVPASMLGNGNAPTPRKIQELMRTACAS